MRPMGGPKRGIFFSFFSLGCDNDEASRAEMRRRSTPGMMLDCSLELDGKQRQMVLVLGMVWLAESNLHRASLEPDQLRIFSRHQRVQRRHIRSQRVR